MRVCWFLRPETAAVRERSIESSLKRGREVGKGSVVHQFWIWMTLAYGTVSVPRFRVRPFGPLLTPVTRPLMYVVVETVFPAASFASME
jgi:hypothetical protein